MTWPLLFGSGLALMLLIAVWWSRRGELRAMRAVRDARDRAVRAGSAAATLQFPAIDLSKCLGCGTCVAVCPEDGVLDLLHGQAAVVQGSRCMGIAACERECPAGAIQVTLGDLDARDDVPVLDQALQAVGTPGLYLAGEVTAHALIRTAVEHGAKVAREVAAQVQVARQLDRQPTLSGTGATARERGVATALAAPPTTRNSAPHDLIIVGAGPAGLACALEARRLGLDFVVLEQEPSLGGTVARYPRGKLVLTQPVELPLHGRLRRTEWRKEELMELWQQLADEHDLPIRCGQTMRSADPRPGGGFTVRTHSGLELQAAHVCLAMGRRGTPRRLGVPGEDLPHVTYALLDARDHAGRSSLVVGGGDSAVEAALGLAEQPGSKVTLAYRGTSFHRIRAKNEARLEAAIEADRLQVLTATVVERIRRDRVTLRHDGPAGPMSSFDLPVDEVLVQAGGVPPLKLLQDTGVSFDPADRPPPRTAGDDQSPGAGRDLRRALLGTALVLLAALAFLGWHHDYYGLPLPERPAHPAHGWLRPGLGLGLGLGIAGTALIGVNLLYLLRRKRVLLRFGSLRAWMTSHVVTGALALVTAALHAGLAPRDTPGGHAFWALLLLMFTGAVGRWFYAFVPRAANGRELELDELRRELDQGAAGSDFAARARDEVTGLVATRAWGHGFASRLRALLVTRRDLRRALQALRSDGLAAGVTAAELAAALHTARRAAALALQTAHLEDLRGLLASWRWLHRWLGLLMVVLLMVHIAHALWFGSYFTADPFVTGTGGVR